jgi:membrane associated rhomboid family serine protease
MDLLDQVVAAHDDASSPLQMKSPTQRPPARGGSPGTRQRGAAFFLGLLRFVRGGPPLLLLLLTPPPRRECWGAFAFAPQGSAARAIRRRRCRRSRAPPPPWEGGEMTTSRNLLARGRSPPDSRRTSDDPPTHAAAPLLRSNRYYWEGDDRRRWTRWIRGARSRASLQFQDQPGRTGLLVANLLVYGAQVATSAAWMRGRFPAEWKSHWPRILADVLLGTALPGPLLRAGGLPDATAVLLSSARGSSPLWVLKGQEPHRYLLSGFLHGSVVHCALDAIAATRIPRWLETGLGTPLYLSAFAASVVAGGAWRRLFSVPDRMAPALPGAAYRCGSSGGICGLYGLLVVTALRMRAGASGGGGQVRWRGIAAGLLWVLLCAYLVPEVSAAGNVGGMVGGAVVGLLFGPRYASSYGMKRKWSTEADAYERDYRRAMGFASQPRPPLLPLPVLWWSAAAMLLVAVPSLRSAPVRVAQALLAPPNNR